MSGYCPGQCTPPDPSRDWYEEVESPIAILQKEERDSRGWRRKTWVFNRDRTIKFKVDFKQGESDDFQTTDWHLHGRMKSGLSPQDLPLWSRLLAAGFEEV